MQNNLQIIGIYMSDFRASLVPVFCFGENNLFKQYPNPEGSYLRKIQTKVKEIATFSPPLFYGRGIFQYTFGFVPFRTPVHAVGKWILFCDNSR